MVRMASITTRLPGLRTLMEVLPKTGKFTTWQEISPVMPSLVNIERRGAINPC